MGEEKIKREENCLQKDHGIWNGCKIRWETFSQNLLMLIWKGLVYFFLLSSAKILSYFLVNNVQGVPGFLKKCDFGLVDWGHMFVINSWFIIYD